MRARIDMCVKLPLWCGATTKVAGLKCDIIKQGATSRLINDARCTPSHFFTAPVGAQGVEEHRQNLRDTSL